MKVRIKETGEVKIVCDYSRIQVEDCDSYGNPQEYKLDEIEIIQDEFIQEKKEGDWNDVRIKAAITAMQGVCSSKDMIDIAKSVALRSDTQWLAIARFCVYTANSIVEQLKKESKSR